MNIKKSPEAIFFNKVTIKRETASIANYKRVKL